MVFNWIFDSSEENDNTNKSNGRQEKLVLAGNGDYPAPESSANVELNSTPEELVFVNRKTLEKETNGNSPLEQINRTNTASSFNFRLDGNDLLTSINQQAQQAMEKGLKQIRQSLQVDRLLVYGFNPDGSGKVLAESVDSRWSRAGSSFDLDYNLNAENCKPYYVVNDISTKGLARCFVESVEAMEGKAYIVVPIKYNDELLGLLSAYQNSGPRNWQEAEVQLMLNAASQFRIPLQQTAFTRKSQFKDQQREKALKREQGLARMLEQIRNAQEEEKIFQIATNEGRKFLEVDRLAIYRFEPDWSGKFIAESVTAGWTKLIDTMLVVQDTYLQETQGGRYKFGECFTVDDIYLVGHQPCHIQLLEQFEARAYMIAPIFSAGKKLWGLIAAYQNTGVRKWQADEAESLRQLGLQVGIAMQQIDNINQLKANSEELARRAERESSIIQFSSRLMNRFAELIQKNTTPKTIMEFAVNELRRVLNTDRTTIYRFESDWSGEFILESVRANYPKLVGTEFAQVKDTYLQETKGGRYLTGEGLYVEDIYQAEENDLPMQLLEESQTKSYMLLPIFQKDQLWGLIGIYQNDHCRHWDNSEKAIVKQVASNIGVALQVGDYLTQLRSQEEKLSELVERERNERQNLQQGALRILASLEPSFRGDLTVRAPLSEDEIGTIADGYNTTIQTLRELVRKVQIAASRVSETSSYNSQSVAKLSNQAQKQVDKLSEALPELELMITSTQEVANCAQKVESRVEEANRTVQAGDSLMEKTVGEILDIRHTVSDTAKKIKRLGETFQKITKVVSLIENFATQTNLLALNAAIEATRAGEYGKGFAVVADEVRSLAYQSANATTEIGRLVDEIRTGTNEVTEAMEVGIAQVVSGTELVRETQKSLSDIVTATSDIKELVQEITQTAENQTQQSNILNEVMADVSEIAQQTSQDANHISESFGELQETSDILQSSVRQFKVD